MESARGDGTNLMLNYVVEFEPDRRIFWEEPAPEDPSRNGTVIDPSKVGHPLAGYRWGYILTRTVWTMPPSCHGAVFGLRNRNGGDRNPC